MRANWTPLYKQTVPGGAHRKVKARCDGEEDSIQGR